MATALTNYDTVDDQLKDVIRNLYALMVQSYDYQGQESANAISVEIKRLVENLVILNRSARELPIEVPSEIIEYIENGRNPDIYTREFVELAQDRNQQLKGKAEAFGQFRDALAREMAGAMPEIKGQVQDVVEATGGRNKKG